VWAQRRLQAGLPLSITVADEDVELQPDDVLVREEPLEGLAVTSERGVTVGIDVEVTEELESEGLARDVVRRIQNLRKKADFDLDDRIVTIYEADEELAEAITAWKDYIAAETLSVEIREGSPEISEVDAWIEDQVEGYALTLGVSKAQR